MLDDKHLPCGCRLISVEKVMALALPCPTHAGKMEFSMHERGKMKLVPANTFTVDSSDIKRLSN